MSRGNASEADYYVKGIFQSIGFKEFHHYLTRAPSSEQRESDEKNRLLEEAVRDLKVSTRRYSRYQVKWIKKRFLQQPDRQVPPVYGLDATNPSDWNGKVRDVAFTVIDRFHRPIKKEDDCPSHEPLPVAQTSSREEPTSFHCSACDRIIIGQRQWQEHLKSTKHRKVVKRANRGVHAGCALTGISKYFQMACIVEKLAQSLNKEVTAKSVWEHLSTMYDLQKLDEHEGVPFPNEETDFVLSTDEFGELMEGKYKKEDVEGKKPIKKEELKKVTETPPPIEKKAIKRTRASTTPSIDAPKVTPKRRRLQGMAMTLQGSVLSNGNSANNRVSLSLEPTTNKDPAVYDAHLNDASNGASDNGVNSVHSDEQEAVAPSDEPVIDIIINNVVCSFSVKSHLNLKQIAQNGFNVEFRRENGMVTMRLRKPYTTASIWSSGKVTCTGATSEDAAKQAARRITRCISKLGYPKLRLVNYRVVNVLGTCTMPFAIKITPFSAKHRDIASYEPELHPGVTYRLKDPKATLKIFSTGSITVTAPCVGNVQAAIEHIYPLVFEFRKERSPEDIRTMQATKRARQGIKRKCSADNFIEDDEEDMECVAISEEEEFGSDQSHD
nr:EOG090X0CO7 [Eurycercus lamellatus]